MTSYVFPPPAVVSVAIAGSGSRFAVRRVLCVGRNYAAHAREMGQDERDPPFFFSKPRDGVVASGTTVPYPPETHDLNYEIELVIALGREARDIDTVAALSCVYGYAVGIDFTRRDLQIKARDMGRPWELGKGFDHSAPCSEIHRVAETGHPEAGRIWLAVNGETKQDGDLSELIWQVPDIISTLSRTMVLKPGDLIFTGTPAGVGPTVPGDVLTGGVEGIGEITITIGPPETS